MKLRGNLLWTFTNFYSFLTKHVPPFSPSHLEYRCLEKLQLFCNQEKKAKNLHNPTLILLSFWTYASSFVLFVLFRHLVVLTLWDPMDRSMPAFPVLQYLLEFAQTHIHWVSGTIQQSHPLLPPSLPALNLPQDQSLVQWVGSSHQMAKSPSNLNFCNIRKSVMLLLIVVTITWNKKMTSFLFYIIVF